MPQKTQKLKTSFRQGGLNPGEELCLAFISYYPDVALHNCKSRIPDVYLNNLAAEAHRLVPLMFYILLYCLSIYSNNWAPGSGRISDLKNFNLSLPGAQAAYDKFWSITNRTAECASLDDALIIVCYFVYYLSCRIRNMYFFSQPRTFICPKA